jgi:ABC-2 type transport system permease protein
MSFAFPTHYIDAWHGLFFQPTRTGDMVHGVLLELPYVAVFLSLAWWRFLRKDVLS